MHSALMCRSPELETLLARFILESGLLTVLEQAPLVVGFD